MKLVTPTGVLPVLLGQQWNEAGMERGMLSVIGADFALEHFDRAGLGAEGLVIPALNGRMPEQDPFLGNGVAPLFGGQFFELGL